MSPRVNVYVDGFNLYYGCLKGTPFKWLDLEAFAAKLAPQQHISRIRYFTALVKPGEPGKDTGTRARQDIYLRALSTLSSVSVHHGHYQTSTKCGFEHPEPASGPRKVAILRSEEKGSDVNLASYLLTDGFQGQYDRAIVISNDADLATPIEMVRDTLKKTITIFFPCTNPGRRKSNRLLTTANHYRDIRIGALRDSQFSDKLVDTVGTFSKPSQW